MPTDLYEVLGVGRNAKEDGVEGGVVDAAFGAEREVRLRAAVMCATCAGSGARPGTTPVTCTECAGAGQVRRVRQSILGQMVTATTCPRCGGIGEEIASV